MSRLFYLVSIIGYALLVGAFLVACLKIFMFVRANRMRALAARWGFRYIGPPAARFSRIWFSSSREVSPPLPRSFPLHGCPLEQMRQVWNVIEGQQNGVSLLIFDGFFSGGKAGWYSTLIACKTQQNPFGTSRVIQAGGWTIFCRVPFLETPWPWTTGIRRLDEYVNRLHIGSVCEP